jgi:hypothetical protein
VATNSTTSTTTTTVTTTLTTSTASTNGDDTFESLATETATKQVNTNYPTLLKDYSLFLKKLFIDLFAFLTERTTI